MAASDEPVEWQNVVLWSLRVPGFSYWLAFFRGVLNDSFYI
jgi:hypothetical protein